MNYKRLSILPLLSILTTLSFAEGEPTEVKTWNIREHSVKVAFKSNLSADTKYRFRFVDEDGTRVDGLRISPLNPSVMESFKINKISGLKSGTHYFVTVISEADAKIRSEEIGFTTKGEKADDNGNDVPTNLKTWNLRETSVKIGFKDNSQLGTEYRFRVVNEDGTRIDGLRTSFKPSGQKDYIVGRISGLKEATIYSVTVIAKEDAKVRSKSIEFITNGVPPLMRVATNLKVWGVKSNSAMISFIRNPPMYSDEDYNKITHFYDVDRENRMTLNSKGIIPVPNNPKYSIGKMINLIPNTTYRIVIREKLNGYAEDDWQTREESHIIEFTTKK